ncbi:MAG: bifunctional [glutamate--ammonia ligase]-adenylyl-L-tyrosine phosphorylase/[glutamate--ammonia-ligase] adenylyltransferase [Proteobacteria bacterium]|nr:bifunctional [glutamate--ammonia ligase]-adenylyl-L-tyrosine phosphorylase/[glutamate--ammonia-ligase] adenylyltransferase [Pseudomonadota bacterium]
MTDLTQNTESLLAPALAHSRYLQQLLFRHADLAQETREQLAQPYTRANMEAQLSAIFELDDQALKRRLRQLRQAVMARLISRELAGLSDLTEVMHTISDLAEVTLAAALAWVSQPDARYGQPIGEESGQVQELIIVGMGKLGGRELNVSSDIDLIFIFPEDGQTTGPRKISNSEYFALIGKRLISLIGEITDEGFVFRVDMRLRPFGDVGPLACSFAALEGYLLTQGREWERYAWIKARALCGDEAGLMQMVTPFVYRKYLDYGAYQSMRELHSQIRREVARKDKIDNIKLGPGGIREIEFIGQVFQLIRGGRNKILQQRPTQAILDELAQQGTLTHAAVAELQEAYSFLRNTEHRLMYLDDAQTQMLPLNADDQARIALSMGFSDWAQFTEQLTLYRGRVNQHFEHVFVLPPDEGEDHPQAAIWLSAQDGDSTDLAALGFENPNEINRRLSSMQSSSRYQQMPDRCRKRIDSILPPLIEVAASFHNPDATFTRILDLLEAISRRESYLALLAEHPRTLKRLASLYSASPWVSQYLTRHPILLDELLDFRLLEELPDWPKLGKILRQELKDLEDDTEAKMDCLRHFQHAQVFRLVCQDLDGLLVLETVSDHLSDLADLMLTVTLEQVWQELPNTHRANPQFAVIGYGKLGGKELGFASDLDIVYLFNDDHPNATEVYAKYAKRIVNWLTALTPAGHLYDIDLRLRPNGTSGLLVSSIGTFAQYQRESAWVWEHQALTRARYCAGDRVVGNAFEAIREDILRTPRDLAKLRDEVRTMRKRMLETHPARAEDVKHVRGGIVDIEFIMQYLILAHAKEHPAFCLNSGNIALLATAAQLGLIPKDAALLAANGYRELRRLQHSSRLNGTELTPKMLIPIQAQLAAVKLLWETLFEEELG